MAFVLQGGASHGAVQAGALLALFDAGFDADILLGASVGAFNATFLAGFTQGGAPELAAVWELIRRRNVFSVNPMTVLFGLLGIRSSIASNRRVAGLALEHIPYARLEHAARPVVVAATDARTGEAVALSSGPTEIALLATTAMPGIFSPVTYEGRLLIDGAISCDAPIEAAIARGATDVLVFPTAAPLPELLPHHPFYLLQQAIGFAIDQHNHTVFLTPNDRANIYIAPTPRTSVNPLDFDQPSKLIALGYEAATIWARTLPVTLRVR
jgi:NTE family protein